MENNELTAKVMAEKVNNVLVAIEQKGESTAKELADLQKAVAKLSNYDVLVKEHAEMYARVKALEEAPKENANNGFKTVDAAIYNALVTNQDAIKKLREDVAKGNASPLAITIKNPVTIGTGNTIGAAEPMYQLTQDTGIISTIRSRELRYLAEVSVGSMASSRALWTEEIDEQGEPTFIGEGDDKAQASVLYDEKTKNVKKIAVFVKITMEMLDDLPQFVSFIMRNLERRLDLKIENQLFKGNDIGDNLKGAFGYATAFTGSDLVAQIENANEIDVIEAVALQVKKAHGTPKAIFINPTTMSKIKLIKDTTGRPVWKDYVTINNELNISGLKVVETEAVLADEFIGGDTKVINVLNRTGLQVQIGLDGNDLTKNKQTMVLEKRLVQFVSGNDTALLVKGLFSTAKALIDKPTS
jgi:HK97 family phage major capsid protein